MNKPIVLIKETRDRKGNIMSHGESVIDASTKRPGEIRSIEDTFEYQHPECYWGGFRNSDDREERFTKAAEGVLSYLKQGFHKAYLKRDVQRVRDSLYGDMEDLIARYYVPGKVFGKLWPSKLATLELSMMAADLECHDKRVYDSLHELLKDRETNSLNIIPFCANATLRTSY